MPAMERTAPKPAAPRRRKPSVDPASPSVDDRFVPHPGRTIDPVYVLAGGFELILARPLPVVGVLAASLLLSGSLGFGLVSLGLVENALFGAAGVEGATHPGAMIVLLVLGWACGLLLQAPLVGSAIEVHTQRRGLHAEFLQRGLVRMGDLVAAGLAVLGISAVAIVVAAVLQIAVLKLTGFVPWQVVTVMLRVAGFVAIVVVVLRVITAFALVVPVIVVEQLPTADALRRAWALGWPNSFPMLMAFILPVLVVQGVMYVVLYLPLFISLPVGLVLGIGLAAYESVLVPVAYVAIREYVDGLDPERLLSAGRRR